MPPFTVQNVIFDLDGTLIDTAADLHAATNHVLTTIGRATIPLMAVRADVGFGALKLIERGLNRTGGLGDHSLEQLKDVFIDYYTQHTAVKSALFPGGKEMLDTLTAKGIGMGICTNKPLKLAEKLLKEMKLDHYFKAVTGGDSFAFKKPDPRHLSETAKLVGEGRYLMVGDSSPDIMAAKAAGVPVIGVSYGYGDVPMADLEPDIIIESLAEVAALVAA